MAGKFLTGGDMFRFKSLFRFLAVGFWIIPILSISPVSADEKPEIFVQMAKESIIYFGGLKFMQEVQT